MSTSITKIFRFEAAHKLPNHDGKCRNLHGHTYKVEVTVAGDLVTTGPQEGMVVDFGYLSRIWKERLESRLDHQYLNDVDPIPTAERIAEFIHVVFSDGLAALDREDLELVSIRVWETETSYAEYFGD